jgi:hypothetical protein
MQGTGNTQLGSTRRLSGSSIRSWFKTERKHSTRWLNGVHEIRYEHHATEVLRKLVTFWHSGTDNINVTGSSSKQYLRIQSLVINKTGGTYSYH